MAKNKKKKKKSKTSASAAPDRLRWSFDPSIPTDDFLEGLNLEEPSDLQEAVEHFVFYLEQDYFLLWECVVRQEQGLRLSSRQQEMLASLINFGDEDDAILEIDESARPSEPWHVILNKIAAHLLVEPYHTAGMYYDVQREGWAEICEALEMHGAELCLPEGARAPIDVVPADLRHKLWLQYCAASTLGGLGQSPELRLANPEEHERVDDFIEALREHKESVVAFDLNLDSLLERIILPDAERGPFVEMVKARLGLTSTAEALAPRL